MDVPFARWYDADGQGPSGWSGRETLACAEDFGVHWSSPLNPIYRRYMNYWNPACRPTRVLDRLIAPEDLTYYPELDKHCLWVSTDNGEECRRFNGVVCTSLTSYGNPCLSNTPATRLACLGMSGRESSIPFVSGTLPPPAPALRVVPRDRAAEVYWDDRSERTPDHLTGLDDLESCRVWRADDWTRPPGSSENTGPSREFWHMIAEFDRVNYLVSAEGRQPQLFGANTGFDAVAYRPVCLDDPRFAGPAAAMREVVWADVTGRHVMRPQLRDRQGLPVPGLEGLLPWEGHPEVLDTFFAVTGRPDTVGTPNPAVGYDRHRDRSCIRIRPRARRSRDSRRCSRPARTPPACASPSQTCRAAAARSASSRWPATWSTRSSTTARRATARPTGTWSAATARRSPAGSCSSR
jgi:hypothetical protein